jgi:hypothetical protein
VELRALAAVSVPARLRGVSTGAGAPAAAASSARVTIPGVRSVERVSFQVSDDSCREVLWR